MAPPAMCILGRFKSVQPDGTHQAFLSGTVSSCLVTLMMGGSLLLFLMADVSWRAMPHASTRAQLLRTVAASLSLAGGARSIAGAASVPRGGPVTPRSVEAIREWSALPVWPAWPTPTSPTGGRVRPMSLAAVGGDPFLLLAHHRHSFSPGDPLRAPFKAVGGALGLPYVGDEGFALHPHRGIDIWTYILDGSDGFRHKDSFGGDCIYRGGACQFMRSGKGAMHEEMWETRSDRPTQVELFQLWVNLPRRQKMSEPAIRYLGDDWRAPYSRETLHDARGMAVGTVRTLDAAVLESAGEGEGEVLHDRPPVALRHASLAPGASWVAPVESGHTAIAYLRRGAVQVNAQVLGEVGPGSTCTFRGDGDAIWLANNGNVAADVLLLTGAPLNEPIAMGGPIVMNSEEEVQQAYADLRAGTFL